MHKNIAYFYTITVFSSVFVVNSRKTAAVSLFVLEICSLNFSECIGPISKMPVPFYSSFQGLSIAQILFHEFQH